MPQTPTPPAPANLNFRVAALSARKPTRFAFRPDAEIRAAMAAELGLIELPAFELVGEIRPAGRNDFLLEAAMKARAVQPCSITLAPVPCTLADTVRRRYDADFHAPEAEEAEMVDDEVEPMPEVLDIRAIAQEALALALPLYPRAKGAELQDANFAAPGLAPLTDKDLKPFAGLQGLADKLKNAAKDGE